MKNVKQEEEFTFIVKDVTDVTEFIHQIQNGIRPRFEDCQPVPELVELIKRCWSADTVKRQTANIVLRKLEMLKITDNNLEIEKYH